MPIIDFTSNKATNAQILYIDQLSIDLQFSRVQRNAHVSDMVGHKIIYLDDLTKQEASTCIETFKAWKESKTKNTQNNMDG